MNEWCFSNTIHELKSLFRLVDKLCLLSSFFFFSHFFAYRNEEYKS